MHPLEAFVSQWGGRAGLVHMASGRWLLGIRDGRDDNLMHEQFAALDLDPDAGDGAPADDPELVLDTGRTSSGPSTHPT